MKEAIIYFTNSDKLEDSGILGENIPEITENNVSYIKYMTNRENVVFLIYDEMSLEEFERQWEDIKGNLDCFWFVHHNKPATEVIHKLQNCRNPKFLGSVQGHHQKGLIANKVYVDLERFVLSCYGNDQDGQKIISQKDYIGLRDVVLGDQILNDKLRLLDKIYSGTTLENMEIPTKYNYEVDRFFAKLETDHYDWQNAFHTENFIIFRDALLKQ